MPENPLRGEIPEHAIQLDLTPEQTAELRKFNGDYKFPIVGWIGMDRTGKKMPVFRTDWKTANKVVNLLLYGKITAPK